MYKSICFTHVGIIALSLGFLPVCSDVDGRDPYALWETFRHEDGLYAFHYLAPPWELVATQSDPDTQTVVIEPVLGDVGTSLETGALEARFKSVVSLRTRTTADEESRSDMARFLETSNRVVANNNFQNAQGREGIHLDVLLPDRNLRAVYFDISERRVVVMQVAGRESIGGEDFMLLLKSLEPEAGQ